MKKYEKKEMLETVSMLIKANNSITKNRNKSSETDIVKVLSECQEIALILGNHLETLGEAGNAQVHILEEYCEAIYQMSVSFSDKQLCKRLSKTIHKYLTDLGKGIKHNLPDDKKEIVFFPYKASMWASLESVWKAASEDETCEVYVVPIPYFDRNHDGTFGQMHYEGNDYPEDVPVTFWQEYNLKEHQPEAAYIHNPYDNCNYVTSVHPMFYAKEVKKYVSKLIYIPYFTAVNDRIEPHFCVLPGILYADIVIVQSETVRRTYVEELHKFEIENNCRGRFGDADKKVLALGSPAYDKIFALNSGGLKIPEDWRKVLYRTDGARKKVVLYNTSIQNILTHNRKMIEKIRDSLKIFEAYQDDIALLWRPHPLIPAALQSMRPDLWEEYNRIVSLYRLAGWGIYDDGMDMNRAIAMSDAYYGDGGSLLALYKATGKTIMIQSVF